MINYQSIKNYLYGTNTMIDRLNSNDEFYLMLPFSNLTDKDKQKLVDWINDGYTD